MSKSTVSRMGGRLPVAGVILALAACSSGGGPTDGDDPPAVAGNYDATFTATQATGCQGFVTAPSSTTGTLRVTQSGSSVTLHISELAPQIASNTVGTISEDGSFHFQGSVLIDPDPDVEDDEVPASGTIDGTLTGASIDLDFDFTLATCTVVGTIVGQR
jgi:hypothetical protein